MMLRALLTDSIRDIRAHPLRVLLTGSGIAWGIALFLAMMACAAAVRAHYRDKMATIGRMVIYTFPGAVARPASGARAIRRIALERDDAARLPRSPLVARAAGEVWMGPAVLKGAGRAKVVWATALDADAGAIRNLAVEAGRFITPTDVAARRRVVVLGARVAQLVFHRRPALGRTVHLDGEPFRVVGVTTAKGRQLITMGPDVDEQVLLPITTAQALFTGRRPIDWIVHEPRAEEAGPASIERVRTILGRHHDFTPRQDEALSFFNVRDAIRPIELIGLGIQIFLAACGVITLAIGGVGVMNIMLVTVAERTHELGVRKALGATNRDLFLGLLLEASIVTTASGLAGLGVGAGLVACLAAAAPAATGTLLPRIVVSPVLAAASFGLLVALGIIAGFVPARRAARLDPATALREASS
jgi:putative ABC transport system permease protein